MEKSYNFDKTILIDDDSNIFKLDGSSPLKIWKFSTWIFQPGFST